MSSNLEAMLARPQDPLRRRLFLGYDPEPVVLCGHHVPLGLPARRRHQVDDQRVVYLFALRHAAASFEAPSIYDSRVDGVLAASTRRRRRRRVVAARREHRCGVATLPSRAGLVELKMTISTTSSQDDVTSRVSVSVECVPFELEGAQCQTPACDQISTFSATIDPRLLETQCPDQTNVTANQEVQLSSHAVQESIKLWRTIVSSIHSSAGYPSWSAWVPSAPASSRPPTT